MTPAELKKALTRSGFEVYRTLPDGIALVERVRENLILDSAIRVAVSEGGFRIRVVFRAEGGAFPGESDEALLQRARALASVANDEGFVATGEQVAPQMDPSRPEVELERFYEVVREREVATWDDVVAAVQRAFAWQRSVPRG